MRSLELAERSSRLATRHALFVAFHYPPEGSSSGVLRTLKYTRYLGSHGWKATVLTLTRDAYDVKDISLEEQIPEDVNVVRTAFVNTKRHLSFKGRYPSILAVPDPWVGWWPWAVLAGRRMMRQAPVDIVYSTSPHATAHLVALSLARRAKVPWVADFRDPWYAEPPEAGTPLLVHAAARRLERLVVRRTDLVVATTGRLRGALAARYASEPRSKFVTIPNGYDEADFSGMNAAPDEATKDLLIVHAGSLDPGFRDPRPIFAAVREAADRGEVDISNVRFRFLGGGAFGESMEMTQAVEAAGLARQVEFLPRVGYKRALAELMKASLLLLLQASADTRDVVPAKLFEYLRTGHPVLAVLTPGATHEVLEETGGGWMADPSSREDLRLAITGAYRAWREGTLENMGADPRAVRRFSREQLAGELAARFESLVRQV